jgi:hypothetical protein
MTGMDDREVVQSNPGREQRKHLRMQIDDASTSFSIKGVSTSLGAGHVSRGRAAINLSEGGAMLLVCEPLAVGTRVVVRIEVEDREEFVEATGEVRWCEPEGRNGKDFHAGIEFVALPPEDRRKIDRMRDWFSSPEYKSRQTTRRRDNQPAPKGENSG